MKLFLLLSVFPLCFLQAQYDPGAITYGGGLHKNIWSKSYGAGARLEYAKNCYTTFLGEVNLSNNSNDIDGELVSSVNLILFNFYPTTITAGMGFLLNFDEDFVENESSFLVFENENVQFGALMKFRALHKVSSPVHIFVEVNFRSLGKEYHTVNIGYNYNFGARR